MIEVEFYDRDTHQCDMCGRGSIVCIAIKGNGLYYDAAHWFCEDHLKELHQKIDPLRVLVMTGKNIKTE